MADIDFGSLEEFRSASVLTPNVTTLSSGTAIIAWNDDTDGDKAKACVATVDGTSISFGTIFTISSDDTSHQNIVKINETQALCVWGNNISYDGECCVLEVSGTTLSKGTTAVFKSEISATARPLFNDLIQLASSKYVVSYRSGPGGLRYGRSTIIEVAGTTATAGAAYTWSATLGSFVNCARITSNAFLLTTRYDPGTDDRGRALVADVAGTVITYNPWYNFEIGDVGNGVAVDKITDTSFLVNWADGAASNAGRARVGTIAGGSLITYDTIANVGSEVNGFQLPGRSIHKIATNKYLLVFEDKSNSDYGTAVLVTNTGGTVTFGTEEHFLSADGSAGGKVDLLTDGKVIIVFRDESDGNYGKAVIGILPAYSINLEISENIDFVMYPGGHQIFASSFRPYTWGSRNESD